MSDVVSLPASAAVEIVEPAWSPVASEQLSALDDLVRGFLLSKRSPKTRQAYATDLASWCGWCASIGVEPLAVGIHHADAYLRLLGEVGDPRTGRVLAPTSINRRTSALHGFYRYAIRQGAKTASPFTGVDRPRVDDESMTTGLTPAEVRQLFVAAASHSPRSEALVRLLVTNGLRISEALAARIEDLSYDAGHRVLRIRRKGGRRAKTPLAPDVIHALEQLIGERAEGPIFATSSGKALDRAGAWRLLRRLAKAAELPAAERISPHSLRHTYATVALDEGAALRDVQDSMGHRDPRTTRLYDRSRQNHSRDATYTVAAALAKG